MPRSGKKIYTFFLRFSPRSGENFLHFFFTLLAAKRRKMLRFFTLFYDFLRFLRFFLHFWPRSGRFFFTLFFYTFSPRSGEKFYTFFLHFCFLHFCQNLNKNTAHECYRMTEYESQTPSQQLRDPASTQICLPQKVLSANEFDLYYKFHKDVAKY